MKNAHPLSKNQGVGFDFCAFLDYDDSADVQLYEIGNYNFYPTWESQLPIKYMTPPRLVAPTGSISL